MFKKNCELLPLIFQAEEKYVEYSREKNELQSCLLENEEELNEIMKKYKSAVQQVG